MFAGPLVPRLPQGTHARLVARMRLGSPSRTLLTHLPCLSLSLARSHSHVHTNALQLSWLPCPHPPTHVCLPCVRVGAQVRKTTAERLYIRVLTIEDKFPGVGVDAVLAVLTQTPWMGALAACLPPRDSLYPLFGLTPPAARLGLAGVDRVQGEAGGHPELSDHAPVEARGGAGDAEAYDSYGALVKEAGY
jgi:hypothetical protein